MCNLIRGLFWERHTRLTPLRDCLSVSLVVWTNPRAVHGRIAAATEGRRGCSFLFGSCLGGQGFGREEGKGFAIFQAMERHDADFFSKCLWEPHLDRCGMKDGGTKSGSAGFELQARGQADTAKPTCLTKSAV